MHDRLGECIHGAIGLVEQQHLGAVDEGANDLGPPRHAGRDFAWEFVAKSLEAGFRQHRIGLFERLSFRQDALHDGAVGDILGQGFPGEQGAVLEHHHALGALLGDGFARPAQDLAVEPDLPRSDRMEAGDGIEQSRLSAARRADDHAHLARRDFHRAIVDSHHVDAAGIVDFGHISNADRAAAGAGRHSRRSIGSRCDRRWRRRHNLPMLLVSGPAAPRRGHAIASTGCRPSAPAPT